jgi:hypothetical protein
MIYIASNAFVLIISWFPANLQETTHTTGATLPYFTGPVASIGIIVFGIVWWTWDSHILPALGYSFWTTEDEPEYSQKWRVEVLRVHFHVCCFISMSSREVQDDG